MIVLKVELNGEVVAVAGKENLSVLTAIVGGTGALGMESENRSKEPDLRLNVGGLEREENGIPGNHLRWCESKALTIGDTISVCILQSDSADVPIIETSSSSEEELKKEIKQRLDWERARAFYLKYKDEFENHD